VSAATRLAIDEGMAATINGAEVRDKNADIRRDDNFVGVVGKRTDEEGNNAQEVVVVNDAELQAVGAEVVVAYRRHCGFRDC
jgi:hypothetical protein